MAFRNTNLPLLYLIYGKMVKSHRESADHFQAGSWEYLMYVIGITKSESSPEVVMKFN